MNNTINKTWMWGLVIILFFGLPFYYFQNNKLNGVSENYVNYLGPKVNKANNDLPFYHLNSENNIVDNNALSAAMLAK